MEITEQVRDRLIHHQVKIILIETTSGAATRVVLIKNYFHEVMYLSVLHEFVIPLFQSFPTT